MKLPTIRGDILVDLNQLPGSYFEMDTTIPANTTAQVYLPKIAENYILTIDGKVVKNAFVDRLWIMVGTSPSGHHTFNIKKI